MSSYFVEDLPMDFFYNIINFVSLAGALNRRLVVRLEGYELQPTCDQLLRFINASQSGLFDLVR